MNRYAVVLNWVTDAADVSSPVLVAVSADSHDEALQIAIAQAESGELLSKLFPDSTFDEEDEMVMEIDHDSSFSCVLHKLLHIN